jgi:glycosyltransferase involved in cell wall biosynthesis
MTANTESDTNIEGGEPREQSRPRVLTFAYACEPDKGSEPGGVWGLVRAAMDFADCVVLVGPEHVEGLRRWQESNRELRAEFVEVPEPSWGRFAKWHRIPRFLLYLSWLKRAKKQAVRLLDEQHFDLSWHASFAVYWLPSPAVDLGIPSVWGPVGGAVTTPLRLWRYLGPAGIVGEILDSVSVRLMAMRPATRRTWKRATLRLFNSEESLRRMPPPLRRDARVLNQALFAVVEPWPSQEREPFVVFPSALEPRKGPRLALAALAHCEGVNLKFVHEGPEERALKRLVGRLGVSDRVEFLGRIPRSQMFEMLAKARVALFTGLKEDGGMALCEAALHGTPIVVLAHGGARVIAEATSDPSRVAAIHPTSSSGTSEQLGGAITKLHDLSQFSDTPSLDQTAVRAGLRRAFYDSVAMSSDYSVASPNAR